MDRGNIIRMAREAGAIFDDDDCLDDCAVEIWARFAALVAAYVRETEFKPDWNNYRQGLVDGAAAEREACAKVCEQRAKDYGYETDFYAQEHVSEALYCAAVIRARGDA